MIYIVGVKEQLCLPLLHLPMEPLSVSLTPGPGMCVFSSVMKNLVSARLLCTSILLPSWKSQTSSMPLLSNTKSTVHIFSLISLEPTVPSIFLCTRVLSKATWPLSGLSPCYLFIHSLKKHLLNIYYVSGITLDTVKPCLTLIFAFPSKWCLNSD